MWQTLSVSKEALSLPSMSKMAVFGMSYLYAYYDYFFYMNNNLSYKICSFSYKTVFLCLVELPGNTN